MNRVLNFAVVAMSAVIMTSSRVDAAVVNITQGSMSGYTMTDGNTYVIQNSVSFCCLFFRNFLCFLLKYF